MTRTQRLSAHVLQLMASNGMCASDVMYHLGATDFGRWSLARAAYSEVLRRSTVAPPHRDCAAIAEGLVRDGWTPNNRRKRGAKGK